jgi:Fe2+ or Zn2+ uptake regulation protein
MDDPHAYRRVLRAHGLSVTRLRLAIMSALHARNRPATAPELMADLQGGLAPHKTSVYRSLAAFERTGLARRVASDGRMAVYELTCPHSMPVHPHFTCRSCGDVLCLDPVDLSAVWDGLTRRHGAAAEKAEITLSGLCEQCAQSAEPGA